VRWLVVVALVALTGCHLVFELGPGIDAPMSDDARTGYAAAVLADAPVAYWRLGNASQDVALDETGNGNIGTYQGGVAPGMPGPLVGDADSATEFDGDDDAITMGDRLSFEGSDAFTIEAWVRVAVHGDHTGIVSKTDETDSGNTRSGYLLFEADTKLGCERTDGVEIQSVTTGALIVDRWSHVAATFDGSRLTLYVDAEVQDTSITPSPVAIPATSMPFAIGGRNGGTWLLFDGSIDEVAIYDRALEMSQLENHRRIALGQ
jgi:hypothetical protein